METTKKLIFFSEDDPLMARMFERIFKLSGFDIVIASDGEEAITRLETLPVSPTLILLDVMMPKRSGFEVLEHIKLHSKYKAVPVVMLSNLSSKEDAERTLQLGAVEYLVKSQYEPKEVVAKVETIINR